MELSSSLYRSKVYHDRRKPKRNAFSYNIFMFLIDLDELELLARRFKFFGYNKPNLFGFYDNDHFKKPKSEKKQSTTLEKLNEFLLQSGIIQMPDKVRLLTHLRIFGYVFNPVSFYYCYDENDNVYCVIAEVSNTYGEMKMYLLQTQSETYFNEIKHKLFYISPFTQLDDYLKLKIGIPGDKVKIIIDDFAENEVKVKTVLSGKKRRLSDWQLIKYILRFPLITLQIVSLIYWQALKLWLKGVKYIPKNENLHLQKEIYFSANKPEDGTIHLPENRIQTTE